MTGLHDISSDRDANAREFHREQLSAMLDGALSADETRFLLRRMQHDDELADCWSRWQLYGDALRGHAGRALPADFSQRVGRAIADDIAAAEAVPVAVSVDARRPLLQRPLLRWGGGAALAASVALAAFLGGREPEAPAAGAIQPAVAVIHPPGAASGAPVPAPLPEPRPESPVGDQAAAAVLMASAAAAATVAENRGAHPRIKAGSRATSLERDRAVAAARAREPAAIVVAQSTQGGDLAPNVQIVSKPWPRALVPGAADNGTVTAGFGDGSDAVHPAFQPRPQSPPRFIELPPSPAAAEAP
jgi:negative regulator of sigma E activity